MYGKTKALGVEIDACCTRPSYADGFIMHKWFPAAVCRNCGEVISTWGWLREWIFRLFLWPFWDGAVHVDFEQVSDEEIERIESFNRGA